MANAANTLPASTLATLRAIASRLRRTGVCPTASDMTHTDSLERAGLVKVDRGYGCVTLTAEGTALVA